MSHYYFARSPRLISNIPDHEVEIDPVPAAMQKPEINWLTVLLPSAVMMFTMIIVSGMSNGTGTYMYMMIAMMLVGVVVSVLNYTSQMKKFKAQGDLRKSRYNEYLESKRSELLECRRKQKEIQNLANPSVFDCRDIVLERKRCLWERTLSDCDFMSIRVGSGSLPLAVSIKTPKLGFSLNDDPFLRDPHKIKEECKQVDGVPILCDLKNYPSCGVVGTSSHVSSLVRSMIINAITHHGYDELKIVATFRNEHYDSWSWMRWLPHILDESGNQRYIAFGRDDTNQLLDKLLPVLKSRQEMGKNYDGNSKQGPYYLFIIEDTSAVGAHPISKILLNQNQNIGCGYIVMSESLMGVPCDAFQIVNISEASGKLYIKKDKTEEKSFIPDSIDISECDFIARSMASVRLVSAFDQNGKLPASISFFDGYGISKPKELNLGELWNRARAEKSMEVPIGVASNGELFYFDINEKKHGPHGLVAGTTGSGKSEMIQSWILSMAIRFSPNDVSFVLIDFKGTGLILPFQKLPHLAGTISDLDSNIGRNLIALRAELQRRKALFDRSGTNNIAGYLKLYREGKVLEPLSYLFVIIDEYAEFKANYPEFTAEVNSLFRTGRALGVHIIILTQNPAGVISGESESNVQFRWCLKVAGVAASREILGGHSDAARITIPGRAYVRVGTDDVFEQIQSLWSGAPYYAEERNKKVVVNLVDMSGEKKSLYSDETKKLEHGHEIDVIVDYISFYARMNKLDNARKVWINQLPNIIYAESECKWDKAPEALRPYVGMIDDPWVQRQYPFRLPISENGHVVLFGAPQSGKTTFLQTLAMSMCNEYAPDKVNLYIMDFGSWSMKIFSDFPHVGAVAYSNEDAAVLKIAQLVECILDERKLQFASEGVGSIQSYNRTGNEELPYVVLLIDNFTPVLQVFPQLEDLFMKLTREGGSYGVYLVASCSNNNGLGYRMQQSIKTKVTLQLTDNSDYSSIVGKTDGLYPMNTVGRGLYKADRVLEFQTALPMNIIDESARSQAIREIGKKYKQAWTGRRPAEPKFMPEHIEYENYATPGEILLGVSTDDVAPTGISYRDTHIMLVSAMQAVDNRKIIRLMSKQIIDNNYELVIVAKEIAANEYNCDGVKIINETSQFDEYMAMLSEILQKRKEAQDNGFEIDMHHIFVLIDELKYRIDEMEQESLNRLNAFAQIGQGLNVMLACFETADILNPLKGYIPFVNRMTKTQMLIKGGSIANHELADIDVDIQRKHIMMKDDEAFLIKDKEVVQIKLITA